MNSTKARQMTIAAMLVPGVLTSVTLFSGTDPKRNVKLVRLGLAVAFIGVVLSIAADAEPELAGAFAALIILTSLFVYGGPAVKAIGRLFPK